MRRSTRILNMVVDNTSKFKDGETASFLDLPFYESTKGTAEHERERAIMWLEAQRVIDHENEDAATTQNTLQNCTITSTEKKRYCLRKSNGDGVKRRLVPLMPEENLPTCSKSLENIVTSTNTESVFEDSGDEYIPSSDDSSSSSEIQMLDFSSEEEIHSRTDATDMKQVPKVSNLRKVSRESNNGKDVSRKSTEIIDDKITIETDNSERMPTRSEHINNEMQLDTVNSENISCTSSSASKTNTITISVTDKDESGKRIRNKMHSCYFCNKILSNNMARHFELVHGNDTEVAKILAMVKGSRNRREAFENLIRVGDFYHNCNVLAIKQGELILVRRPEEMKTFSYDDFGPCPNCLGFLMKKYLWHHLKVGCTVKKSIQSISSPKKGPLRESSALLFQFVGNGAVSTDFRKFILDSLRSDEITFLCKGDSLILNLGAFLFEKYGTSQSELIRQSMRQLGRLKIELKKLHNTEDDNIQDFLTPSKFDQIIAATKALCGCTYRSTEKRNEYDIPSLALKVGHLLRKCIAIERGAALRKGDLNRNKSLESLLSLMDIEWSVRISSNALLTLHKRKMNAKQLLPLTSDLRKLSMHLMKQMETLKLEVLDSCTKQSWGRLSAVTLCRIILFNKRRSGEASRMTLEHYYSRPSWSEQGTEEFKNSLTPMERELANRLTVVEIVGKRNRKVPVILTNEVKSCLDVLLKMRKEGEISEDNPYIFARSQSNNHLRGHDCLRKECADAGLFSAENITSTKLRKYIATVCQIFDLKEHECDWLARHLGHDIRVHRDFYRMHESAVEVTKVSRILLAVDKGQAQKFSGKQLKDINVDDLPDVDLDSEEEIEGQETAAERESEQNLSEYLEMDTTSLETSTSRGGRKKKTVASKKKKINNRKTWSAEEKRSVLTHFKTLIKHGNIPGKTACEECINKHPILKERKWTDLKFCVKNHLFNINKQKSKI